MTEKKLPPHRALTDFYREPGRRAGFVQQLFDRTAGDYNLISGLLSLGTDQRYRGWAMKRAGVRAGMRMLDVATGTGLMARAALGLGIAARDLVGLDPSWGMLGENRRKTGIGLVQGFGEKLPFRDEQFDFVVMGYALRHVEDLRALFDEFNRVLKTEGKILILEITRPAPGVALTLTRWYFQGVVPLFSKLVTRNPEAGKLMEYYWATIAECVPPPAILEALRAAGFERPERRCCGPILSEYVGEKRGGS